MLSIEVSIEVCLERGQAIHDFEGADVGLEEKPAQDVIDREKQGLVLSPRMIEIHVGPEFRTSSRQ
jgi:hypothetical protein